MAWSEWFFATGLGIGVAVLCILAYEAWRCAREVQAHRRRCGKP